MSRRYTAIGTAAVTRKKLKGAKDYGDYLIIYISISSRQG